MNDKELLERIQGMENKLDKIQNIEERLETCFKNVEKFRDNMIQNGYSYAMLEEFNKAIQPITQHYNEIRNARKKLQILKDEQERMAKEAKLKKQKRASMMIEHILLRPAEPQFPYHHKCRNFSFVDGEPICDVKMDLQFCNKNCPYATDQLCSNKVDGKGNTVAYKRRKRV